MDKEPEKHNSHFFWIGLFLGGLIGAILIILLGTEKGKKLAVELTEQGFDFFEDKKKQVKEKADELVETGQELVNRGKEMLQEGRELEDKVAQKAESAIGHIEQIRERGRLASANIRKKLFKNIPKKK